MQDTPTPAPYPQNPVPPPPYYRPQQRRTRWWIPVLIVVVILVVIFAMIAGFVAFVASNLDTKSEPISVKDNTVLMLDLSGGVPENSPAMAFNFGGSSKSGPSLLEMLIAIRNAKTDDNIKGIYYRAGGAGMGAAKLADIREALVDFKTTKKFVYAFIETGNKQHYYIASVADSIFMPEEGMLDFTAYGASSMFMKGTFDKIGVNWYVEQFEEYKSAAESLTRDKWSEPAKQEVREIVTQRVDMFVSAVSTSRNIPAPTVRAILDRGLYTADSLRNNKLIDGFARESELRERIHRRMNPTDTTVHPKLRMLTMGQYKSSGSGASDKEVADSDNSIAIVYASGAIQSGKNDSPFESDGIFAKNLIKELRKARDNKDVKVIILRVDSPGGSAIASDEIWSEIREIRKLKPVYASMSDVAASGGYYIAMACDTIIAHPATITGSIGVIMAIPNLAGTMGKIGVTHDTISTGTSSNFMNPMMPFREADKATLRALGGGIYRRFVQKVADSRKMTFEATREVAKGRVWTGTAAKQAGLIDMNGGLFDAIATAKRRMGVSVDKRVKIHVYPEEIDNISALLVMFGLKDEDEDEGKAQIDVKSMLKAVVSDNTAAEQIWNAMPYEAQAQVRHAAQLTHLGMREHTLVMLPMLLD